MASARSRIPFRVALSVISIILITTTSLGIGIYTYLSTRNLVDELAGDVFDGLFSKVFVLAQERLHSSAYILELNRASIAHGRIPADDPKALGLYELLAPSGQLTDAQRTLRTHYELALDALLEHRGRDALEHIDAALDVDPDDTPSQHLRQRALDTISSGSFTHATVS